MTPQEARLALERHLPCAFFSKKARGWLDADTFYNVAIVSVRDDPLSLRIELQSLDRLGLGISVASEDFGMLQSTSVMQEEFVEVKFDLQHFGENYTNIGDIAFIPVDLVDELGMEEAFQQCTGFASVHIIHWSENVTVDRYEIWRRGHTDVTWTRVVM